MRSLRLLVSFVAVSAAFAVSAGDAREQDAAGRELADAAPPRSRAEASADTRTAPAASAGVRAAIDPFTGELIEPSPLHDDAPEERDTERPAIGPQDFTRIRVERLEGGVLRAELDGQFDMATFARIEPNGVAAIWCKGHGNEASGTTHSDAHADTDAAAYADDSPR